MSKQLDISSMLKDMDKLQIERNPLPDHYVAKLDQHDRELYASLLAAIILIDGSVSENKGRLFEMLLTALKLKGSQAKMFQLAQNIELDRLRDFCRLSDEHSVGVSFFVDALILSRIDAPINDTQSQMLSQWVTLLNLCEADVIGSVYVASAVLGLPTNATVGRQFNIDAISVWCEYAAIPLDIDTLKKGITSGYWLVDKPLKADFSWSIENAYVIFNAEAVISTNGEFNININNSNIKNSQFNFAKLEILNLENSNIFGDYKESKEITVFTLKNITSASLKKLKINTVNARSFYIENSLTQINECEFLRCGNMFLMGGALCSWRSYGYINNCRFIKCYSKLGGAIRTNYLPKNSINNCYFEQCLSLFFQDPNQPKRWNDAWGKPVGSGDGLRNNVNGGALFVNTAEKNAVNDSKFVAANVYLGEEITQSTLIANCTFIDSILTYSQYDYRNTTVVSNLKFSTGELKLESRDFSTSYTKASKLELDWLDKY